MNKMTLAAAALASIGLTACTPDDPTSEAFCAAFADASTFTLDCDQGCEVTDPANAYDGDLDTATRFVPVAGQTEATVTLRVRNGASGVDLDAGLVPGVFVTRPDSGTFGTLLTTYFNSGPNPVDSTAITEQRVLQSVESGSAAETFLGVRTDDTFDEVRFVTSYDWGSDAEAPTYFLYEVCSDGGNA